MNFFVKIIVLTLLYIIMTPLPHNTWIPLNPEVSDNGATHAMLSHGQVILRLRPREEYAYGRDSDDKAFILPETKHVVTTLSMVGHFSSSASTAWRTADGTRSHHEHTLEDATHGMILAAEGRKNERGDRVVSRETIRAWMKPDDLIVDLSPVPYVDFLSPKTNILKPKT